MKVWFRVDASQRIGSGHVVRCLTLAKRLKDLGAECRFVIRQLPGHLATAIEDAGFEARMLPAPVESLALRDGNSREHESWLGLPAEEDAEETLQAMDGSVDWLVVDHYALDASWENVLRNKATRIAVIDDLANRPHDCDLLLDQNYFKDAANRYVDLVPDTCIRLYGPRYALLQKEYSTGSNERKKTFPPENILVFYGGSDLGGETLRAIRVLSKPPFADRNLNVVVGPSNPAGDEIGSLCNRRGRAVVYTGLKSMADLIVEADLALGAGGTSTWERCAMGVPSVITPIANNQLQLTQELVDLDLAYTAGDWRTINDDALRAVLLDVFADIGRFERMSVCSREITDGLGADRVAFAIKPESPEALSLVPATCDHKMIYYNWVNDPEVRRSAFENRPVAWADHDMWYDSRLAMAETRMWALVTGTGLPIGQIRLEPGPGGHKIDYSIDAVARGHGLGAVLLQLMIKECRELSFVAAVRGEVKSSNLASLRAFRRTGVFREENDHVRQVHIFTCSDLQ